VQLDNTVEVETPEHAGLRFHVAGPTRRAWAYVADLLVRIVALVLFEGLAVLVTGSRLHWSKGLVNGVTLLSLFLAEWGYFVVFETLWNGCTPGKRLLKLRVVKEGGYPLSFADAVLRNLLRAADFLPLGYLLGLAVMSWDGRFARLGDRAAGTMVVIEDPVMAEPPMAVEPPPTAVELQWIARAPSLHRPECDAIELLLRRRDLSPARQRELADILAPSLAVRLDRKPDDPVRFLALLYLAKVSSSVHRLGAANLGPAPARVRS
jgi:uncharacterized RDD family membrane protein YckC